MLVLTAAVVAPYFIDWTDYRADFEREASQILGREVKVVGEAEARLLPFPSVTFSDVRVAGETPDRPVVTVERFSMDAELAPFMRGEILIFDMRLEKPRVRIEAAADGTIDWAMRPSIPLGAAQISLEKVAVRDGELRFHHGASGRTHVARDIDADVTARTLAGPWRVEGRAILDETATGFSLSTGTPDEKGAMRVRLRLAPEDYPLRIETDGSARLAAGALAYDGSFRLNAGAGADRSIGEAADGQAEAKGPAQYRMTGGFSLEHEALTVPEFRIETGPADAPYTASGSASLDFGGAPRFAIKADGAQFRLDEAAGAAVGPGLSLAERIDAVGRFLASLPRPAIPGEIDVDLPAMVVGDSTIRSIAIRAEPAEEGWRLNRFTALLPGRTTLEASGTLATGEELGFRGRMLVAVGQPSGFAAWLARDVDEAIRRLPAAGFEADVDLTRQEQRLSKGELILGEARFRGGLERRQIDGARPSIRLDLDGGALDVDSLEAFASLFVSRSGEQRLADHDLDLAVMAGPVTGRGLSAETLDTALRLRRDAIEIDRLSIGGLAGASVSATGTIRDFPQRPAGSIDASVVAVDLAPLAGFLATRFGEVPLLSRLAANAQAYPGLLQDARFDLVASAAAEEDARTGIAVSANGTAGGTRFSATASAKTSSAAPADWPVTLSFEAENDEAASIYALYGLPALPLGFAERLRTTVDLAGSHRDGLAGGLRAEGEGIALRYDGSLKAGSSGLEGEGTASLRADDIEPWLMTAGVSFPGMGFETPVTLSGRLSSDGSVLSFAGWRGSVLDRPFRADIAASLREGRPHLEGSMALDSADAAWLAALVVGENAFAPGDGQWPETAFLPQTVSPATADLSVEAARLTTAAGIVEDARFKATVGADGIAVSDFAGAFAGGRLSGLAELRNNAGTGLLSAQGRLEGADLAALSGLAGRADLTGSVTASGKSVDGLIASLSGSGSVAAQDLVLPGLNPDGLGAVLAEADRIGRDIDAAGVAGFVPQIAGQGDFPAGEAEIAFTLAGGQLRAPPLHLASGPARLAADIRADLATWRFTATGDLFYDAGTEAVAGSEPVVRFVAEGPIGAVETGFDSAPMAQYLTQRALEKEQARVEAMQAALVEKQRLRREVRYYDAREAERQRIEEERRRAEEEARRLKEEARLRAEEEARLAAEEAARIRAEEEAARIEAEEAARIEAEEAARIEAEEAARRAAEDAARREADGVTVPDRVERVPAPPPGRGSGEETGATEEGPAPRGMFEVFRNDGTSIDAILKSLEETQ